MNLEVKDCTGRETGMVVLFGHVYSALREQEALGLGWKVDGGGAGFMHGLGDVFCSSHRRKLGKWVYAGMQLLSCVGLRCAQGILVTAFVDSTSGKRGQGSGLEGALPWALRCSRIKAWITELSCL